MSPDQSTISVRRGTANCSRLRQFVADDRHDPFTRPKNLKVFLDLAGEFFQLVGDFFDADLGQALQAQFKDGAGLVSDRL